PNLEGIYFAGDAPTRYYDNTLEDTDMVTIYYNEGTSGWTNPWYGRPAIVNYGNGLKFTWATPAPIYAGTPLGAEQLNATVNVPGSFKYSPGFGTILDAGTYVLNAAFTPKDGNYKSVSGAVMLEVLPLGLAYTYNANGTATVSGIGTLSEETEIEIPETVEYNGEIYSVTAIGEAAFKDNTTLTHVLIPNSVTSIGSEAFRGCTNLQEMIMPNSVTRINWAAFMDCANLGNLVISENCTYISGSAFERCYALTDLYIPDSVTQIDGSTFRSCNGLIRVTIGNGLTSIDGYVFDLCSNLERVELGTGVNTIQDRAFGGCSKLTKVTFAGNAPASCSGSAFADAPATLYYITGTEGWTDPWNGMPTVAVDLDPPVIITQPASQIAMTEDTVSLTVTAIGSADLIYQWYKDGSAIKGATDSIYTIDSVQMADAGSYAVTVSNGVNSVTSEEATLTVIDSTPTGDPAEDFAYTISGGVVTITGYLGSNEIVTIPNIIERCFVRTLGSASFRANNLIKKVVIPDTVKTIEGRVFLDSQSLESVEIGEGVETIGSWAFAGCVKLKTMVIPDSVTRTDGAFFNNPGLTSIIIGSNVTNFGDTFGLCGNLKSIYFKGNAPVANNIEANATVYYFSGTTGWTDPWCGRPAVEIDGILITEQPQSEILLEGDTVTFNTAVVGIGDLSYQWNKDGEAIKGATDSIYTIDSV
ncbi:MAG: leucine-rich repeat protein, partial [Verrucomicrobia bacterium]|nr:leucine-rich repeat protein [Verrucomicrobiota bacterium]